MLFFINSWAQLFSKRDSLNLSQYLNCQLFNMPLISNVLEACIALTIAPSCPYKLQSAVFLSFIETHHCLQLLEQLN